MARKFRGEVFEQSQIALREYVRALEGNDEELVVPENVLDLLVKSEVRVAIHCEIIDVVYCLDSRDKGKKTQRDKGAQNQRFPGVSGGNTADRFHGHPKLKPFRETKEAVMRVIPMGRTDLWK